MAARSESARRVSDCVTALLRDQPFFGSLALRLPMTDSPTKPARPWPAMARTFATRPNGWRTPMPTAGKPGSRPAPRWRAWVLACIGAMPRPRPSHPAAGARPASRPRPRTWRAGNARSLAAGLEERPRGQDRQDAARRHGFILAYQRPSTPGHGIGGAPNEAYDRLPERGRHDDAGGSRATRLHPESRCGWTVAATAEDPAECGDGDEDQSDHVNGPSGARRGPCKTQDLRTGRNRAAAAPGSHQQPDPGCYRAWPRKTPRRDRPATPLRHNRSRASWTPDDGCAGART